MAVSTHATRANPAVPAPAEEALDAVIVLTHGLCRAAVVAVAERDRVTPLRTAGPVPDDVLALLSGADPEGDPLEGWTVIREPAGPDRALIALLGTDAPDPGAVGLVRLTLARAALSLVLERDARRDERLERLLATTRSVVEPLELDAVLAAIVRDAARLLGADSGDMLLLDEARETLRVAAVWNFPAEMIGFELRMGEGLSSEVIRLGRTIGVDDYRTYEHRAATLDRYDFGAVLCSPLLFRGEPIGTLNLHATDRSHRFLPEDHELLAAFAAHAAIAIDHARRYENEVRLGQVLAETNRDLSRSLVVQQRLAEQVLLDGGPGGMARVLAEHLHRGVVIQDHLHRVIAGASPDAGEEWRALAERGSGGTTRAAPSGGPEPFSVAVRVGRDVVGHLLLGADRELGPVDRALIDIAITGVALEFAKVRAAVEVEERLRGEAASDLLGGTYTSEEAIAARAARLGYDLSEPRDLLVVHVAADASGADASPELAADASRRSLDVVRERIGARAPRSLATIHGGTIVVLAGRSASGDKGATSLAAELQAALVETAAGRPVTVVIGDRCSRPNDYAPSLRLARASLEVMLRIGRAGAIIGARELGAYGLLLRATSREELEAFARRLLGPLLERDRRHGGELVRTLRVYLEEDRVQRRVAARCFIHVNTVVYRLRRIEELLGRDLDDATTVFELTLALRILDLLEPPDADAGPSGPPRAPRTSAAASRSGRAPATARSSGRR